MASARLVRHSMPKGGVNCESAPKWDPFSSPGKHLISERKLVRGGVRGRRRSGPCWWRAFSVRSATYAEISRGPTSVLIHRHCTSVHDPAFGQDHKSADLIGTFDDFNAEMRQNLCNPFRKFRSLIATVDEQRLQKW